MNAASHLNRCLVIVGLVKEEGVCRGGDEGPDTGLNESPHGMATIAMDQRPQLIAVLSTHCL